VISHYGYYNENDVLCDYMKRYCLIDNVISYNHINLIEKCKTNIREHITTTLCVRFSCPWLVDAFSG